MSTYTIPSSQIKRPADLCVPILHGLLVSSVPFFLRLLGSSDRLLVTSAVVSRAGVVFGYYFSTFQILRFCNAFDKTMLQMNRWSTQRPDVRLYSVAWFPSLCSCCSITGLTETAPSESK